MGEITENQLPGTPQSGRDVCSPQKPFFAFYSQHPVASWTNPSPSMVFDNLLTIFERHFYGHRSVAATLGLEERPLGIGYLGKTYIYES